MKRLFFLFLLSFPLFTLAQLDFKPVNMSDIKSEISKKRKTTYYPALLERYHAFDTTLTLEEWRLLYYGFALSPDYNGYDDQKKKEIAGFIQNKDYNSAILTCDTVFKKVPLSLVANYYKSVAMYLKDTASTDGFKYRERYYQLLGAIYSSGNGVNCETGFKVLYIPDEYEIVYRLFNLQGTKGQSLDGNCDKIHLDPCKFFPYSAMFFEISELQESMKRLFSDKKLNSKKS